MTRRRRRPTIVPLPAARARVWRTVRWWIPLPLATALGGVWVSRLTWSGRAVRVWYPIRRLVITPAPTADRCVMGSPVDDNVWCPRQAVDGEIWCRRHMPRNSRP